MIKLQDIKCASSFGICLKAKKTFYICFQLCWSLFLLILQPNTIKDNKPFLGRPVGERNASFGAQKFVELNILNTFDYIRDDQLFIKCEIDSEFMMLLWTVCRMWDRIMLHTVWFPKLLVAMFEISLLITLNFPNVHPIECDIMRIASPII